MEMVSGRVQGKTRKSSRVVRKITKFPKVPQVSLSVENFVLEVATVLRGHYRHNY